MQNAHAICLQYLSASAAENALYPNPWSYGKFPIGDEWTRPTPPVDLSDPDSTKPDEPFTGDQILANSCRRMKDSMLHYEFQCAISDGDIGRAMNVMAVSLFCCYILCAGFIFTFIYQVWAFTFTGSGKSKYSNELLELTCNFEFEYTPALQELVKNNWLCNLSGIEGCWFGLDLLQEKNIKRLKKMAQRRDADFGGDFFQEIVALNVRAFIQATESMNAAVRLTKKGGAHQRTKKAAAMKELTTEMQDQQLHRFRQGRTLGHKAADDFEKGYLLLTKKIPEFISRTLKDAGAIHADDDIDSDTPDESNDVPMPNMMVRGFLVAADEIDLEDVEGEVRQMEDKIMKGLFTGGESSSDSNDSSDEEEI